MSWQHYLWRWKTLLLWSMSVLQNEQIKIFTHLKWMTSSTSIVTPLMFVLLTVFSLCSLRCRCRKRFEKFLAGVKKKWTTWLVEFWKCENLQLFQFHSDIFSYWVKKFNPRNWRTSESWFSTNFSEILFIFWQFYSDFGGSYGEVFRVKNFGLDKQFFCIY